MHRFAVSLLPALVVAGCAVFGNGEAPLPPGTQDCIGMDPVVCAQLLRNATGSRNAVPVAWRIRCTATCDRNSGDAEITISWSDGTTEITGTTWMGEIGPGVGPPAPVGPVPTPAVPPNCLGVPQHQCLEEWAQSLANLDVDQREHVAAVRVQCTTVCNALKGDGTTTVILDDGTPIQVSGWGYDGQP